MKPWDAIFRFWFGPAEIPLDLPALTKLTDLWFEKDPNTDERIRVQFASDMERAARGELDAWAEEPEGRLALVILLDQFPRNAFRGSPRAWAYDARSCALALEGIALHHDARLSPTERYVFYMPLVHAEDVGSQDLSLTKFEALVGDAPAALLPEFESALHYAKLHRNIVVRFGRFPHRNAILGRRSTPEELSFLDEPDSSF